MTTLIMTSKLFQGQIEFTFDPEGSLTNIKFDQVDLSDKQKKALLERMAWNVNEIKDFKNRTKASEFVLQQSEITFDMFWNRYDDKIRSSKKKTEAAWNKKKKADQVKAYIYIPAYFKNKGTAEKKYATTYLNDELWNN